MRVSNKQVVFAMILFCFEIYVIFLLLQEAMEQ